MWFILLFAASTLIIPIAFEIHYKGRDNILTRSGKELLELGWVKAIRDFFGVVGEATVAVYFVLLALGALTLLWKLFSMLGSHNK